MSADKYPSIFSPQMVTIVYIFPNFQNCARCEKDLKDNKDNSLHLGRKHARIFVLGHNLFLVAHSFPQASLSENCSLLGTGNVRQMATIVYLFSHFDWFSPMIYWRTDARLKSSLQSFSLCCFKMAEGFEN